MSNNFPYASRIASRHSNTTIPLLPELADTGFSSSTGSTSGAEVLPARAQCCSSTPSNSLSPNPQQGSTYRQVQVVGYHEDSCDWGGKISAAEAGDVEEQSFMGGKSATNMTSVMASDGVKNRDSSKIKWRSDKNKKETVSAGLLIALGVAGIVIGQ